MLGSSDTIPVFLFQSAIMRGVMIERHNVVMHDALLVAAFQVVASPLRNALQNILRDFALQKC